MHAELVKHELLRQHFAPSAISSKSKESLSFGPSRGSNRLDLDCYSFGRFVAASFELHTLKKKKPYFKHKLYD